MITAESTLTKIAVVGFAEGHIHEAPFGDPEWELWGINRLHTVEQAQGQTFHRWFNLHDLEKFHGNDHEHLEFLKNFEGPVYLRAEDVGKYPIPNAVPFPASELVKRFGSYFNNTISWLLAFALVHDGLTDLGVFGVDMAMDQLLQAEYGSQRPSCEYFLGLAAGQGITVHLPEGSDLLKASHLYGFEEPDVFTQKCISRLNELGMRKEKIKAEMAQIDARKQELFAAINQLDGAQQDLQYWLRNWIPQFAGYPVVESPDGQKGT